MPRLHATAHRTPLILLLAALAPLVAGAQAPLTPTDPRAVPMLARLAGQPASPLVPVVERFGVDRSALLRRYSVEHSPVRRDRLVELYTGWQSQLRGIDFAALPQEGRIDHVLLNARLRSELLQIERDRAKGAEVASLVPFAGALAELQDRRRALEPVDAPAAARSLASITRQIDSLRRAIERTTPARRDSSAPAGTRRDSGAVRRDSGSPPTGPAAQQGAGNGSTGNGSGAAIADPDHARKVMAHRAVQITESLRGSLEQWYRYYSGYDPIFTWWSADPYKKTNEALRAYVKTLRERVLGFREGEDEPIVGDPIGAAALRQDLELAFIAYTPEELVAIAEREFAWSEAEMKKAARAMGFGDDWKAALEKVKNSYVDPGKQPELILAMAREATEFVESRDLVTVPALAKEIWRMEMMTPEAQKASPFFLGGEVIQVSYPTDAMGHDDKMMSMRGNNPHFSRAVVHHELIPGHHLQGFMTARHNSHRGAFSTPFWTEGWALYWEMLLWDLDFPRTNEDRVGMLFWRMHRSARIIFSLRFHLGTMTPQQAIDLLVNRVGHERANATAEVRRSFNGNYGPLYQLAYMIGGLQFRAMHQELVGSGRMTDKQFHDAVLQGGNMPVEMVRARIVGTPLTADHRPAWRFAGSLPGGR